MVGACLALGLANQGKSILILEPNLPTAFSPQQAPDLRISAISAGSVDLLTGLGAWQHVLGMRAKALTGLSVWEEQQARTNFSAQELGKASIGYMAENRIVQLALHQALSKCDKVSWLTESALKSIRSDTNHVELVLSNNKVIQAALLVGADGSRSSVRSLANITTSGWQYSQQALGILIECHTESEAVTWQQFCPTGPRAFLPMYDNFASLVWYDSKERLDQLKGLPADKLKAQVLAAFPRELPDFKVIKCAAFPLTRLHATHYYKERVAIIGDAAHCINPLAGQGVNLGFKDVKVLLGELKAVIDLSDGRQVTKALANYQNRRMLDNLAMMSAMDILYKGFSNDIAPIKRLRNLGLKLANISPFAKKQAMKYAMGLE